MKYKPELLGIKQRREKFVRRGRRVLLRKLVCLVVLFACLLSLFVAVWLQLPCNRLRPDPFACFVLRGR